MSPCPCPCPLETVGVGVTNLPALCYPCPALLQSLLCLAVLSYNMAAAPLQQGDAAAPYSSQTTDHSTTLHLLRTITVHQKLSSQQTFTGQQSYWTVNTR